MFELFALQAEDIQILKKRNSLKQRKYWLRCVRRDLLSISVPPGAPCQYVRVVACETERELASVYGPSP